MKEILPSDYRPWLETVKTTIRSAQIKAALAVNEQLIRLYWELGRMIVQKQEEVSWGTAVVEQLAHDLKNEFPDMSGFSRSNLFYMRQFYLHYRNADEKVQQLAGQIPWWHNVMIFSKCKSINESTFYLEETMRNGWSRNMLVIQIENNLYSRQVKAITNFTRTLPQPLAELAEQTLKDPYIFDFLTLASDARELDLERQLTHYIIEVEYALRDMNKPIGVSEWLLTTKLPDNLRPSLPSVEEIEQELEERLKNKA